MSDSTNTGLNGTNLVMGIAVADQQGVAREDAMKPILLTSMAASSGGIMASFLPLMFIFEEKNKVISKDKEIAVLHKSLAEATDKVSSAEAAKVAAEKAKATAERERDDYKTRLDRCKAKHPDCDCGGSSVPVTGGYGSTVPGTTAEVSASAEGGKTASTG